jgi:hypothetical protein
MHSRTVGTLTGFTTGVAAAVAAEIESVAGPAGEVLEQLVHEGYFGKVGR